MVAKYTGRYILLSIRARPELPAELQSEVPELQAGLQRNANPTVSCAER